MALQPFANVAAQAQHHTTYVQAYASEVTLAAQTRQIQMAIKKSGGGKALN